MSVCVHAMVTGDRCGICGRILKPLTTAKVVQYARFMTRAAGPEDSGDPILVLASAVVVLAPTEEEREALKLARAVLDNDTSGHDVAAGIAALDRLLAASEPQS